MLRYAWVGGSIMGAEAAGALAVSVGLILFWLKWRPMLNRQSGVGIYVPKQNST